LANKVNGRSTVYNKITSKDKLEKINIKNKELQNDFLGYLESIDRSPKTITQYENDLNIFFVWNLENNENKFYVDSKKRDIIRFQGYCINKLKWSPKRTRRVRSAISSLSKYIVNILDEEYPDYKNLIEKIEAPANEAVREKTVIPDELVQFLLDHLIKTEQYEKAVAIAICAFSGMRKSELLQMKMSFFDKEHLEYEGSLYKTDKIRGKGRGKKGKQINKYIMAKVSYYIDLWIAKRKELGIDLDDVFVTRSGGKWAPRKTIDHWCAEFSKIVNLDVYWHSFRHYTCTLLNEYNLPPEVIKEFFAWDSSEMISIYNDRTAESDFGKYFSASGAIKQDETNFKDIK